MRRLTRRRPSTVVAADDAVQLSAALEINQKEQDAGFACAGGFVLGKLSRGDVIGLDDPPRGGDEWISLLFGAVIGIAACCVYHAWTESSASQATLGTRALGIKVTDLCGHRISFKRALGRCTAKIVSLLILSIGFILAARTEKRQSLHDVIAGTLVMKVR